jgi:acyl-coenzyme A synthetase/AMP-(fatty) acid ligase
VAQSLSYTGDLPPEDFNLARYCLSGKPAERTALIVGSESGAARWSFGAIEERVLRMANGLRKAGLEPRARVAIRMGNSLDYALSFFAANAAGLVPVPLSPMLVEAEVERLIVDCGAAAVIADGSLAPPSHDMILEPAGLSLASPGDYARTKKDDPAFLVYTSGTTAIPKGVLHAQRSVWGRRPMYQGWYGITPSDVVLHTGALNWTYTLGTGLCDPWANGASAVIFTGSRDDAVWERLAKDHGATLFASVPGLYRALLRKGFKAPQSLRHGLVAGETLPLTVLRRWREETGLPLYEAIGMSEISTYISSSPTVPTREGSPGKAQPGRSIRILDGGLIGVHRSDPGLMLGYWNRPREEEEVWRGEWFAGGDVGSIDADGYVWHEGRANELMNAGGYRVSPLEVEAVLATAPHVNEVAVAEVRPSEDVSIIMAFVVPLPGADAQKILKHAAARLAAYKLPKEIRFVEALPRTANGKVVRGKLGTVG